MSHLQSNQLDMNDYSTQLFHNNRDNKSASSAPVVLLTSIHPIARRLPLKSLDPGIEFIEMPIVFSEVFAFRGLKWVTLLHIPR